MLVSANTHAPAFLMFRRTHARLDRFGLNANVNLKNVNSNRLTMNVKKKKKFPQQKE